MGKADLDRGFLRNQETKLCNKATYRTSFESLALLRFLPASYFVTFPAISLFQENWLL